MDELVQYKMQLPKDLRDKLTELGEAADRSLSAEIVWRLRQSLTPEWPEFIAKVGDRERQEQALLEQLRQTPDAFKQVAELLHNLLSEDAEGTVKDAVDKPTTPTAKDEPKAKPSIIRRRF